MSQLLIDLVAEEAIEKVKDLLAQTNTVDVNYIGSVSSQLLFGEEAEPKTIQVTAIYIAIFKSNVELVKLLLANGATLTEQLFFEWWTLREKPIV